MADVTVTYKGSPIIELSDSGSKSIDTAGFFCDANILLQYVKPGGGSGLNYKTGTFTLEEDTKAQSSSPSITHNLGAVPRLVLVWTEAYSQASPPAANLNGGYFMSKDLFSDLKTRITSSATAEWNVYVPFLITTSQGISEAPPTSTTYWPGSSRLPTSTQFFLPYTGGSNYWRAGVTYKYLVLGDWAA